MEPARRFALDNHNSILFLSPVTRHGRSLRYTRLLVSREFCPEEREVRGRLVDSDTDCVSPSRSRFCFPRRQTDSPRPLPRLGATGSSTKASFSSTASSESLLVSGLEATVEGKPVLTGRYPLNLLLSGIAYSTVVTLPTSTTTALARSTTTSAIRTPAAAVTRSSSSSGFVTSHSTASPIDYEYYSLPPNSSTSTSTRPTVVTTEGGIWVSGNGTTYNALASQEAASSSSVALHGNGTKSDNGNAYEEGPPR